MECLCRDLWHAKSLSSSGWDMDSQGSADKNPEVGALKVVGKSIANIMASEDTREL